VGLNLTGANRLILLEPDWNPAVDIQVDFIHIFIIFHIIIIQYDIFGILLINPRLWGEYGEKGKPNLYTFIV
jgi:hypothetical protein